jgi:hypothetical protein
VCKVQQQEKPAAQTKVQQGNETNNEIISASRVHEAKKKKFYFKKSHKCARIGKRDRNENDNSVWQRDAPGDLHESSALRQKKNTKLLYKGKKERKCTRIIRSKFCNNKKAKLV